LAEWYPRFPRAYAGLDGLFFDEFLKHVPIIHPVLGRKQITEDPQLATIACALGSLAAEDVPPGYVCATWMETYRRVSTKAVRSLDTVSPLLLTALQKAGATGCITDFLLEFCFLHAVQIFRSQPNSMVITTRKVIEVYCIFSVVRTLAYIDLTLQTIRRDSVISKLSTYPLVPPVNISDDAMRAAWHQWIRYEMSKRYASLRPSDFSAERDSGPCGCCSSLTRSATCSSATNHC